MGRRIDWEKRRQWEDRLARRESSGLTVAEFCEWEGVSVAAFYQWRKKFSDGTESRPASNQPASAVSRNGGALRSPLTGPSAFLPVQLTESKMINDSPGPARTVAAFPHIEVQLPNGVCVFVPMSDAGTLRDVFITASNLVSAQENARC
jgi:hypothetical protein